MLWLLLLEFYELCCLDTCFLLRTHSDAAMKLSLAVAGWTRWFSSTSSFHSNVQLTLWNHVNTVQLFLLVSNHCSGATIAVDLGKESGTKDLESRVTAYTTFESAVDSLLRLVSKCMEGYKTVLLPFHYHAFLAAQGPTNFGSNQMICDADWDEVRPIVYFYISFT